MPLPSAVLDWLYQRLEHEYFDVHRTFSDTAQLLSTMPSIKPKTDVYTFETGHSELLLNLSGPLPTVIGGATYGIPIEMWVPKQYPSAPPVVYVRPTDSMLIQPGQFVDQNGQTHFEWSPNQSLLGLATMFSEVFALNPPVYARPAVQGPSQPPQPSQPNYNNQPVQQPQTQPHTEHQYGGHYNGGYPQHGNLPAYSQRDGPQTSNSAAQPGYNPLQTRPQQPLPVAYEQHKQPVNIMDEDAAPTVIPPLPPNPQRIDAIRHLNEAIASAGAQIKTNEVQHDLTSLENTSQVLQWLDNALNKEKTSLEQAISHSEANTGTLDARIAEARALVARAHQDKETLPNAGDLVLADTPLGNQLLQTLAEDRAIGDTIQALVKGLDQERIKLDVFLKHTRALARDQFMARALVLKCAEAS